MASTPGARHLAESKIWLAYQKRPEEIHAPNTAPLIETAIQHMDSSKVAAFLEWLEEALEAE